MKTSEYWKQRFEQLEDSSHSYGISTYAKIEPAFEEAQRQIDKEIEAWYGRFAKNNEVSIQEARKMLSASELKEFHWDVKEYIRYGQENAVDGLWIKELENASTKYHISRLEALKVRTQQAIEVAFGNELDAVDDMARRVYTDGYYHSVFEMQRGIGIGWQIGQIDERTLSKVVTKPWASDGKTFSDRIWDAKTQLVNELHIELTRNCILGKAPDQAISNIAKKFNTTKSQAGRLVMTEQAYFHSLAQKEAFKELDVENYEIVATLDSHTSEICRVMDGKVFPMDEYSPGSTAPPFHPWCRTVTVPSFEDNFGGQRAARDENGNTYYVPDSMTFKDWEKKYVKDANAAFATKSDIEMFNRYKGVLKELCPETLDDFIKIKYNDTAEWEQLKQHYRIVNRYDVQGDVPIQTILDLDKVAFYTKKTGFDFSALSGEERCKVKQLTRCGNAASMLLEGKTYFSHSRFDVPGSLEMESYIGEYTPIGLSRNPLFKVKDLGDGVSRQYDTEAKFLEYVAGVKKPSDKFVVTILSEKHICESCQGVVKQFQKMFPNATINIVSGKLNYNSSELGLKTWKHRKKVQ